MEAEEGVALPPSPASSAESSFFVSIGERRCWPRRPRPFRRGSLSHSEPPVDLGRRRGFRLPTRGPSRSQEEGVEPQVSSSGDVPLRKGSIASVLTAWAARVLVVDADCSTPTGNFTESSRSRWASRNHRVGNTRRSTLRNLGEHQSLKPQITNE